MKKEEIIRYLEDLRESIAWEKPLYYLVAIDEAIETIKGSDENDEQRKADKNKPV